MSDEKNRQDARAAAAAACVLLFERTVTPQSAHGTHGTQTHTHTPEESTSTVPPSPGVPVPTRAEYDAARARLHACLATSHPPDAFAPVLAVLDAHPDEADDAAPALFTWRAALLSYIAGGDSDSIQWQPFPEAAWGASRLAARVRNPCELLRERAVDLAAWLLAQDTSRALCDMAHCADAWDRAQTHVYAPSFENRGRKANRVAFGEVLTDLAHPVAYPMRFYGSELFNAGRPELDWRLRALAALVAAKAAWNAVQEDEPYEWGYKVARMQAAGDPATRGKVSPCCFCACCQYFLRRHGVTSVAPPPLHGVTAPTDHQHVGGGTKP